MRLHVLGLPFSETTRDWSHCAFTDRTRVFCDMMMSIGAEVFLYAGANNEAAVTEHIALTDPDEQRSWWPDYSPKRDVFNDFNVRSRGWSSWNIRAAHAIMERSSPGDILCITMGLAQRPVAEMLPELFHVESGVGYPGVFAPYRIYESYAWMHHIAGRLGYDDVRFFDTVLPRAYPITDFPSGHGDGDYYLFLGRLTERKGIRIAAETCQRIGATLVVAGQGDLDSLNLPGDVGYVGTVNAAERANLLAGAIATFTPSIYLEPFCGVSVESQLCGTPVISTDWGAFVENVRNGQSGFRCNTLAEFIAAAELAPTLDRPSIREYAVNTWSCDFLSYDYARYFDRIGTLRGDGWYETRDLDVSVLKHLAS